MGFTHVLLKVRETRKTAGEQEIDFLVDSGAIHSLVPGKTLQELGIECSKQLTFVSADGPKVERQGCLPNQSLQHNPKCTA